MTLPAKIGIMGALAFVLGMLSYSFASGVSKLNKQSWLAESAPVIVFVVLLTIMGFVIAVRVAGTFTSYKTKPKPEYEAWITDPGQFSSDYSYFVKEWLIFPLCSLALGSLLFIVAFVLSYCGSFALGDYLGV